MEELHCPVMGTKVDPKKAKEKGLLSTYQGKEYYFCCPSCKPEFDAHPEKYVKNK